MKQDKPDPIQLSLFGEPAQKVSKPEKRPPRYYHEPLRSPKEDHSFAEQIRAGRVEILMAEGKRHGYPAILIEVAPEHPFSISAGEFGYQYVVQMGATTEEINAAIERLAQIDLPEMEVIRIRASLLDWGYRHHYPGFRFPFSHPLDGNLRIGIIHPGHDRWMYDLYPRPHTHPYDVPERYQGEWLEMAMQQCNHFDQGVERIEKWSIPFSPEG